MNYKTFDRHANMTKTTLNNVGDIITELELNDAPSELINQTYGLYDGYLYKMLSYRLANFFQPISSETYEKVRQVFFEVADYDFNTQVN